MTMVPTRGGVLVLTGDTETAERLARWVSAAGEEPVVVAGVEKYFMHRGDDETIDAVLTELDTDDPKARELLERLLGGEVFPGIPQVHVFRDLNLWRQWESRSAALASASVIPAPPEARDLQSSVRLSAEIGRLRRELRRASQRDPMTGLFDRSFLIRRLEEEFSRSRRYRTPLSLVHFDIDQLKRINDRLGHETGDSVIRRVADVLRVQLRREDIVARLGEESFAAILPGNRYRGAAVFANKVRTQTEEILLQHERGSFQVRVSAGISCYPDNRSLRSAEDLLRATENALAEAKRRGGNRVFIDEAVLRQDRRVILVADADRSLLDLAEDLLTMDDHRVLRADSGAALLESLRCCKPDLLVLDLELRDHEGGRPLVDRIQEMFPGTRIPIIGLASSPGSDPEPLTHLGVDRYLTKPFSLTLLRSLSRELLDGYRER